jgi:hypothetical protein
MGRLGDHYISAQDSFLFDDDAFYHDTPGANETIVFDDIGAGLRGL